MKYLRMKSNEVGASSTAEILKVCINDPPQGGFTSQDIRTLQRVLDSIEAGGDVLAMEDTDAKAVQKRVAEMKWKIIHPDILAFVDAVANLPDKPPAVA
jgi:hypothetical protein